MLKSSNLNSLIATDVTVTTAVATNTSGSSKSRDSQQLHVVGSNSIQSTTAKPVYVENFDSNATASAEVAYNAGDQELAPTLAALQLAAGALQIFEPPLLKAKGQLKELIGKQNKIYVDLSAEKYKLDNAEVANLHEMMNNVKIYREKLIRIKKQMQSIYQRSRVMKKRAANIETYKQKEMQRKIQKQQQEESLIGKQQQQK